MKLFLYLITITLLIFLVVDWGMPLFNTQRHKVRSLESQYEETKLQNTPNLQSLVKQLQIEKVKEGKYVIRIALPITVLVSIGAMLVFTTFPPKRKQLM